ncbi:hypothetical protein [Ideonella sp.]|uniref:hypothetical protein n=1 Tax=Ideonella sp. TaxID=1929293 RepID=UPI002B48ED5D|nr:hypothetical protein [Ideonella sp.]HJV70678.1 hypothetical protein [Ideonella sp.]
MKQVVRAAVAATALLVGVSAQAALVKYRMTGLVTQSGIFDDGSTVPEGTPVTVTYSYETKTASFVMDRHDDGSGSAGYAFGAPYHFKLRAGAHRAQADQFQVALNNDLNQPFGDTYDVATSIGVAIDGVWQDGARLGISLMSQAGHLDALHSLSLPKHLKAWAFDAFRVGQLVTTGDRTLLMFRIDTIKSTVCTETVPGTDDCAQ